MWNANCSQKGKEKGSAPVSPREKGSVPVSWGWGFLASLPRAPSTATSPPPKKQGGECSEHSPQAQIDNQSALQHTPTMIEAPRRTAIVVEKTNTGFSALVPDLACCIASGHKQREASSFFLSAE